MTDRLTAAAHDVIAERKRQIDAEGWTPEHDDDDHMAGDIAKAAAAYALSSAGLLGYAEKIFPWDEFKPKDKRRDLVRAGALILAEIERIDRRDEAARREAEGPTMRDVLLTLAKSCGPETYDKALDMLADAPPPTAPDDLVGRLRWWANDELLDATPDMKGSLDDALLAAADAIEALRAELDEWQGTARRVERHANEQLRRAEAAEAEATRMRTALLICIARIENPAMSPDANWVLERARAALAGGNDG